MKCWFPGDMINKVLKHMKTTSKYYPANFLAVIRNLQQNVDIIHHVNCIYCTWNLLFVSIKNDQMYL